MTSVKTNIPSVGANNQGKNRNGILNNLNLTQPEENPQENSIPSFTQNENDSRISLDSLDPQPSLEKTIQYVNEILNLSPMPTNVEAHIKGEIERGVNPSEEVNKVKCPGVVNSSGYYFKKDFGKNFLDIGKDWYKKTQGERNQVLGRWHQDSKGIVLRLGFNGRYNVIALDFDVKDYYDQHTLDATVLGFLDSNPTLKNAPICRSVNGGIRILLGVKNLEYCTKSKIDVLYSSDPRSPLEILTEKCHIAPTVGVKKGSTWGEPIYGKYEWISGFGKELPILEKVSDLGVTPKEPERKTPEIPARVTAAYSQVNGDWHTLTNDQKRSKCLEYIPADIPQDDWVSVCGAIKDSGGTFDEFHEWSTTSTKHSSRKDFNQSCRTTWDNRKKGIDEDSAIGQLVTKAKFYGLTIPKKSPGKKNTTPQSPHGGGGCKINRMCNQIREACGKDLRFNEWTNEVLINGERFDFDMVDTTLAVDYKINVDSMAQYRIIQSVVRVAKERGFHPIKDYLSKCPNESPSFLDDAASRYFKTTDQISNIQFKKFLISLVARVMEPGCGVRGVLILKGLQKCGKSTTVRILARHKWYGELRSLKVVSGDKDALMEFHD